MSLRKDSVEFGVWSVELKDKTHKKQPPTFDIQFFGGGGSAKQYRKREPEPEELVNLRKSLYNAVSPTVGNFATGWGKAGETADNALGLQNQLLGGVQGSLDKSNGILDGMMSLINGDMLGTVRNGMTNLVQNDILGLARGDMKNAVKDMQSFVSSGNVPTALTDAANASVMKALNSSVGSTLNSLANRGVVNSSIMSRNINNLTRNAADAMNTNYLNAYNSVLNGHNSVINGYNGLMSGYGNALSGYNSIMSGYGNALSGYGSALSGAQGNTGNLLNAISALGGVPGQVYEGAAAALTPAYNFWNAWQNSYDRREDYDTVVQQGK